MHLACNYPCILTSPRKLTKLPPWTGEPLNPQDGRLFKYNTVAWRGEGPLYTEYAGLETPVLTVLTYTA